MMDCKGCRFYKTAAEWENRDPSGFLHQLKMCYQPWSPDAPRTTHYPVDDRLQCMRYEKEQKVYGMEVDLEHIEAQIAKKEKEEIFKVLKDLPAKTRKDIYDYAMKRSDEIIRGIGED
jgi:hypothetical protein